MTFASIFSWVWGITFWTILEFRVGLWTGFIRSKGYWQAYLVCYFVYFTFKRAIFVKSLSRFSVGWLRCFLLDFDVSSGSSLNTFGSANSLLKRDVISTIPYNMLSLTILDFLVLLWNGTLLTFVTS